MVEKLSTTDWLHIVKFLSKKDVGNLKLVNSKIAISTPDPINRTLQVDLTLKIEKFIQDFNFIANSRIPINVKLLMGEQCIKLYHKWGPLMQNLLQNHPYRIKKLEIFGKLQIRTISHSISKISSLEKVLFNRIDLLRNNNLSSNRVLFTSIQLNFHDEVPNISNIPGFCVSIPLEVPKYKEEAIEYVNQN